MNATGTPSGSKSYTEYLQDIADRYFDETGQKTATAKEIAVWALANDQWEPPPDLILRKCREDVANAMREQYVKNSIGQPVRAKHVARYRSGSEQKHLWADIRTAPRQFMVRAFQQRREQIVGDCRQLDRDVTYYNDQHPDETEIQLLLDFRDDVEEGKYPTEYNPKKPR